MGEKNRLSVSLQIENLTHAAADNRSRRWQPNAVYYCVHIAHTDAIYKIILAMFVLG